METKVWVRTDTETMLYGWEWDSGRSSILAKTFARLVELARDKVKFYVSDLYHDALWLEKHVTSPMGFEYVIRESGTHIGTEACQYFMDGKASEGFDLYRLVIRLDDNGRWVLDTYQYVMDRPHADLSTEECEWATKPAGCIYHPADIKFEPKDAEIPTLGNDYLSIGEVDDHGTPVPAVMEKIVNKYTEHIIVPTRKEMTMDSILDSLREKLDEVTQARDELEDFQRQLEDEIEKANNNIDSLEEAINALDISLEDIDFEARVSFDGSY